MSYYSGYHAQNQLFSQGAGGEIGGGTAKQMAGWGAKLALIDIHEGRLNEVLAKCAEMGLPSENIYSVVGDVMKQEVVTSFVEGVVQAFGTVSFLVSIHGLNYLFKFPINRFSAKINWNKRQIIRLRNLLFVSVTASWHGNAFRIIGHRWGESTRNRWTSLAEELEIWCFDVFLSSWINWWTQSRVTGNLKRNGAHVVLLYGELDCANTKFIFVEELINVI